MNVYHLKVSLFGYHEQPINSLHRIIEISENSTFEDLHEAIFEAFDRFDPHLYTFFMTKKDSKSMQDIMDAPAITNPYSVNEHMMFNSKPDNAATTQIKDAKLKEKDVFHYWFDFGDDWWHRIRLEEITTNNRRKKPFTKVTKKVGNSPAQYPDYDEYDDEDFDEAFDIDDIDSMMTKIDFDSINPDEIDTIVNKMMPIFDKIENGNGTNSIEIMQEALNDTGVDGMVDILKMMGQPTDHETRFMLNNIAVIQFLENMDDPDISVQEERDLVANLVNTLQARLEVLDNKIANNASQVTPKNK